MPSRHFFLDFSSIPPGLTEQAYVSWREALRELFDGCTVVHVEHCYRFCCGFVRALRDMQAVEANVYEHLEKQLQHIRNDRLAFLQAQK